jgi:hypothetical protein
VPLRPLRFLCTIAVVALVVGLHPARADDAEAVKETLFQAKKAYDGETQKFRKAVAELLDKREGAARQAGNKKLVDQIKFEQKAFENEGELPTGVPIALLVQMRTARTTLDKVYAASVKAYVRLKDDAAAEAIEKEQKRFQVSSLVLCGKRTYLATLKHNELKDEKDWFTDNGKQYGTGLPFKRDGRFAPHSIQTHPASRAAAEVHYQLGGKWSAFRTSVGVPKIEDDAEPPSSALTFEILGDGKSLWKSEPVTKLDTLQACELSVAKVKVLTLRVHCPGENRYARAVWFEPVVVE